MLRWMVMAMAGTVLAGCPKFDAPPQAMILGLEEGTLANPGEDITIGWHEAIDLSSLQLRIVRLDLNEEGVLLPEATTFFQHGPAGDVGGTGTLGANEAFFTIDVDSTLPVATQLAVVIEPGLRDKEGNAWEVQQILKFTFPFTCGGDGEEKPTAFPADSVHFMLAEVDEPLQVQLQLLAHMRVDPANGMFVGQFSNADRDASIDCAPLACAAEQVCRTIPEKACVKPSENAGSADEFPDFTHNATPPTGYTFTVEGCIRDEEDGSFVLANVPADIEVESPNVKAQGIEFAMNFRYDEAGVLRGQGSFKAPDILLGDDSFGAATGSCTMRDIPADQIPEGLPPPP